MKRTIISWFGTLALVTPLYSAAINAEEQATTSPAQSAGSMGGMQHSTGSVTPGQQGQGAMGGMQHSMGGMSQGQNQQAQGGMGGMQHGTAGGGMMSGMGGGMMGSMSPMTEQQKEELLKQALDQDLKLGVLRRQITEAKDDAERERLKAEHRKVFKEHLPKLHKLMMQEHMQSMHNQPVSGGQQGQP